MVSEEFDIGAERDVVVELGPGGVGADFGTFD
jgi:hypothetical protein